MRPLLVTDNTPSLSVGKSNRALTRTMLLRLALVLTLIVGLGIRVVAIAHTNQFQVGNPFFDDSFYYFSLGRNLASGNGFRIDAFHITTGFQPLWGVLVALPYLVSPANGIIGIQYLGVFVGVIAFFSIFALTYRYTGSRLISLICAGLWWILPIVVTMNLNGMETTLAVACALIVLYRVDCLYARNNKYDLPLLGLSLGIAILARVDMIVLAMAVVFMLFINPAGRARIRTVVVCAVYTLIPLLPWVVLTYALKKPLLPESGQAIQTLTIGFNNGLSNSIHDQLVAFLQQIDSQIFPLTWLHDLLFGLPVGSLALLGFIFALRRDRRMSIPILILMLWLSGITVAYVFFIHGQWFFSRYAQPLAQISGIVLIVLWFRYVIAKPSRRRIFLYGTCLALAGIVGLWSYQNSDNHWILDNQHDNDGFAMLTTWLNAHVPSTARIGAFQTGEIGYYSGAPVIDLDGKVNADAREALKDSQMWAYICSQHIDYLADEQAMFVWFLYPRSQTWSNDYLSHLASFRPSTDPAEWSFDVYSVNRQYCPTQ